jgi:AraC-like DNA-binding protein
MAYRYQHEKRIRYAQVPEWEEVDVYIGDAVTAPERLQFPEGLEIRLIIRGVARIALGGWVYFAHEGWLAPLPPRQLHSVSAASAEGCSFFALRIGPALLDRLRGALPSVTGLRVAHGTVAAAPELVSAVSAAYRVLANGTPGEDARQTLTRAVRELACWGTRVEIESPERPTRRAPGVDKALAHLRANYAQDIALDDLAAAAGLSKFHFLRVFSARLGITPHRYQLLLRVVHAKDLLRDGLDIADVALRTGFFDQSHFTRCFHEIVGVTPGRYQLDLAPESPRARPPAIARNFVQDTQRKVF